MIRLALVATLASISLSLAVPTVAAADDVNSIQVSDESLESALTRAGENRSQIAQALESAPQQHQAAVRFLVAYMPTDDLQRLTAEYILKNVKVAYQAREATKWGRQIPDAVFFNDVLPYASINERRDDWREDFYTRFLPLVKDCETPGEAAQVLNRDIYKLLDVQYHARKRPKPDQSPYESIDAKYASCTGLSVLLIDACRAVCVPTRFVGTARWTTKRGNHSWVEIWSEGDWHFTGACEYNAKGLDLGWFTKDAAAAKKDDRRYAIWASSWRTTGASFPMVWARRNETVAAVNVTDRYKPAEQKQSVPDGKVLAGIDLWSSQGGERIARDVTVRHSAEMVAKGRTKDTGDDTNNRLEILLDPATEYDIEIQQAGGTTRTMSFRTSKEKRQWVKLVLNDSSQGAAAKQANVAIAALEKFLEQPRDQRGELDSQPFSQASLSRADAERAAELLWNDQAQWIRESRADEMSERAISIDGKTLRFDHTSFGDEAPGERSLYISMHGGGNTRPEVNTRSWKRHQNLYKLDAGIYLCPRAPTDTWNMWHQAHIDPLFDRLISNLIVFEGVDPKRVYLMGYSAGGDGVYQVAPRTADRWAAAAMMAGHPNETSPLGLRNIGFALHMGGEDKAYNRNRVAREWKEKLAELRKQDPTGYRHQAQIHEGKGHWMELQDAVAIPWMAKFVRDLRPKRVVWLQDDVTHGRFYWLAVDKDQQRQRTLVKASREGQVIDIETEDVDAITVLLDDQMLDLSQPVTIKFNGQERFSGSVERTIAALAESLAERSDPDAMFAARVRVER